MKKVFFCSLMLAAAILAAAQIGLMPPVQAASCTCPEFLAKIAQGWAGAATCAQAKSLCSADAQNKAEAGCTAGVCAFGSLTYRPASGACVPDPYTPGQVAIDCDLEYRCYKCPFTPIY